MGSEMCIRDRVNGEFPDDQPVGWETFYPIPTPEGIQGTFDTSTDNFDALDMQQLSLARERAEKVGDLELSRSLGKLIEESVKRG